MRCQKGTQSLAQFRRVRASPDCASVRQSPTPMRAKRAERQTILARTGTGKKGFTFWLMTEGNTSSSSPQGARYTHSPHYHSALACRCAFVPPAEDPGGSTARLAAAPTPMRAKRAERQTGAAGPSLSYAGPPSSGPTTPSDFSTEPKAPTWTPRAGAGIRCRVSGAGVRRQQLSSN